MMLEVKKLSGDLREAVILYNRGLLSSCLAAYILRSALQAHGLHGVVTVIPHHIQQRDIGVGFAPKEHPEVVDLYLVGVEGYEQSIYNFFLGEEVRSVTMFPIAIGAAHGFFNSLKEHRAQGIGKGVSLELVTDREAGNLPGVVRAWCTLQGMPSGPHSVNFVQGYARVYAGKHHHNSQEAQDSDLADVFYRQCVADSAVETSTVYSDCLQAYDEQLTKFSDLMQYGFDSWVAKGIASIEHNREALQGNLLMAVMGPGHVVIAPNTRDQSFNLGYLLRKRYPESRAVILYHCQRGNSGTEYIYRVLRGATPTQNPFSILADVARDGRPQTVLSSPLSPERVHRIADKAMVLQHPIKHQKVG